MYAQTPLCRSRGCEIIIDNDLDEVKDQDDQCPDTPYGEDVDENGCAASQKDDDNDGVNNLLDKCPNTNKYLDTEGAFLKMQLVTLSYPVHPIEIILCLDEAIDPWEATVLSSYAGPNLSVNVSGLLMV